MKFTRKKSIFITGIFCGLILSSFLLCRFYSSQKKAQAAMPGSTAGWNWNNATGWISDNCLNDYNDDGILESHCIDNGYAADYGVILDKTIGGIYSYAWNPNIGWIQFDPAGPYPDLPNNNGDNSALYNSASKELSGWAKLVNPDFADDAWIKLQGPLESAPASYALCRGCAATNCDVCYELASDGGSGKVGTQCSSCAGAPKSCSTCNKTYRYGVVALGYDLGVNGIKNILEGWAYNGGTNKNIGWIHFNYAYANAHMPWAFDNFSADLTTVPPANTCKSVDLSWESSSWASSYEIWRDTGSSSSQDCSAASYYLSSGSDVTSICSDGSCAAQDSTLNENTYYCFKIKAVNDYDSTDCTNNSPAHPCPKQVKTPLCAPDDFTADDKTCGEINLSWTDKSNETVYRIYRSLENIDATSSATFIATLPADTISYKDEEIVPRQTYYYLLTAISAVGDESPAAKVSSQTLCYKGAQWQEE